MTHLLLLAAAAAAAAASSPATDAPAANAPAAAALASFRDWVAGCDNVKDCEAQALIPEGEEENGVIVAITRPAGPGTQASLTIPFAGNEPVALVIDGKRMPQPLRVRDQQVVFGPIATPTVLPELLKGSRLQLIDVRGVVVGVASLAGISAALRYIDDQQGRGGTVTALVAKGAKPPTAVPGRAAPPVIARAATDRSAAPDKLGKAALAALRAASACELEDGRSEGESWIRLDTGKTLLLLSCGAGAYNFSSAIYLVESSGGKRPKLTARPAPFDVDPGELVADGGATLLTNADWDAKEGLLSEHARSRGIGDCGTSAVYAWDGERFRLSERRQMDECRGSINWIRTWTAELGKPVSVR